MKHHEISWGGIPPVFVVVPTAVLIFLNIFYTSLAWPVSDDICRATHDPTLAGIISQTESYYMTWTGRWLSMGSYSVFMPRIGIASYGYTIALLLMQIVWGSIFYLTVSVIFEGAVGKLNKLSIALLLLMLFWLGMPGPNESFYWLTGAFEYATPLLLTVVGLAALRRGTVRHAVLASILGLLIGGLNELISTIYVLLLTAWAMLAWYYGHRRQALVAAVVCAFAVIGFAINMLAPGNAVRAAYEFGDNGKISAF